MRQFAKTLKGLDPPPKNALSMIDKNKKKATDDV